MINRCQYPFMFNPHGTKMFMDPSAMVGNDFADYSVTQKCGFHVVRKQAGCLVVCRKHSSAHINSWRLQIDLQAREGNLEDLILLSDLFHGERMASRFFPGNQPLSVVVLDIFLLICLCSVDYQLLLAFKSRLMAIRCRTNTLCNTEKMNNNMRILLQKVYPTSVPMCYIRGIRSGNPQGAQPHKRERDVRDNYSEAANKSLDKTKSIEEKMNDTEDLPREIPGIDKEMAKKLKEQVERRVGQGAYPPNPGATLNERDPRD